MVNIYEILQRAASLKEETALNSISPERAGGIMYDTLLALNDLWLQQGSALVISKIYASVAAMEADTAPVSDLTGKPLRPGQIVVIASSDSDNGSVYRYNGTDAPSWSLVGAIGNLTPVDSLDSDSTTLPLAAHQGKVLDGKISQLGQYVNNPEWVIVVTDSEGKILYGVKTDGEFYLGAGRQPQVKEDGKSLINSEYASAKSAIENPEYLELILDAADKVLCGITKDGAMQINLDIDTPAVFKSYVKSSEHVDIKTDKVGKILGSTDINGVKSISSQKYDKSVGDYHSINYKLNFGLVARKNFQKDNCLPLGNWDVPSYYRSYLDKKINDFSKLIRKTIINGDAFYFITDTHWEFNQQHSPALIKELNRTLNLQRLFHGGDVYSEGLRLDKYGIDCINELRDALDYSNKVYESDGNHEYISRTETYGDTFSQYRIFLDDVVFGGQNKNYYYTDNKEKKIRYIILASYGEYVNGAITYGFEDGEQLSWFEEVALNVESGWDIIVFCHFLTSSSPYYGITLTINGAENVYDIVNNYQGNGNIIAFLTGHTHYDCISMSSCKVPIICSTCDHNRAFQFSGEIQGKLIGFTDFSDLIEPRIIRTITEQAFDVVVYDKEKSLLHLCRVGSRAMNRTMDFPGNKQVDYRTIVLDKMTPGNTKILEPLIDGVITWSSADSSIASVSNGQILANAVGNTVVTAESSNGEIQSFFIRII